VSTTEQRARVIQTPRTERKGNILASWLSSTDHKIIGHLYLITSFFFFLCAGIMALLMRIQLLGPDLLGSRTRPPVLTWALCGSLIFAEETAEDGPTLDPLMGEVGDRVVGPRRAELSAAMGTPSVVVGRVPGQDRLQMPLAEDQHPVGDLVRAVSTNLSA
jgi:hypothetical protein